VEVDSGANTIGVHDTDIQALDYWRETALNDDSLRKILNQTEGWRLARALLYHPIRIATRVPRYAAMTMNIPCRVRRISELSHCDGQGWCHCHDVYALAIIAHWENILREHAFRKVGYARRRH